MGKNLYAAKIHGDRMDLSAQEAARIHEETQKGEAGMISFFLGLFLGGWIGFVIAAVLAMERDEE